MRNILLIFFIALFFSISAYPADKLSTEELIANLKASDAKVRGKAAEELGERGEKLGVEALVEATADKDPKVQLAVVKALGKINHPNQVSSISQALKNTSGDAQKEALQILTQYYIQAKDRNALQELWGSVARIFTAPKPVMVEPWIHVDQEAVDAILFVLDQKESENRIAAAAALGILRAENALPRLVFYLKSPNSQMLRTCIRSIGYIGKREVGGELIPLLKHEDEDVVMDAALVLGLFRYQPALPELRQFLDYNKDDDYKRVILQAISRIGDPSSEEVFVQYQDSKDKDLRQYAIEGFGRIDKTQYVQTLQTQYQREKNNQIKLALCFSLYSLGESAYLDSLVRYNDDREYRDQVREYLYELGPKAIPGIAAYIKPAGKDAKIALIRVLGDMRQPEAIPYLESYTRDENLEIAQEATDAVRKLRKIQNTSESP